MNPVLLLHGALGSSAQLDPLKLLLTARGREVYTMNFSGHGGESFSNQFGIEQFAEDVSSYLRAASLTEVDIFGYSMGGYVALWLASKYPEKIGSIVTLGTKFDWDPLSAEKETAKLKAAKIEEKVPAFARILKSRHAPNDWKELLAKTSDMMLSLGKKPMLTDQVLSDIACKASILLGDQDDMADRAYSQAVARMLPNATFRLLEATPHPIEKVDLMKIAAAIG